MTLLLISLLSAAPLPDLPPPLGRMVDVLVEPGTAPSLNEKIVSAELKGCDHPQLIHVTRFVSGVMFAVQQLGEWLDKTPGLEAQLFPRKGVLGELITQVSGSLPAEQHACTPVSKTAAAAPKLCAGAGATEAWLLSEKKPAAFVHWESSKDCRPRIAATLYDSKGAARLLYDADFAGAASVLLMGDKCQIALTFDASKQVFHAERRGCKGP